MKTALQYAEEELDEIMELADDLEDKLSSPKLQPDERMELMKELHELKDRINWLSEGLGY